jgi:hypothetical protein
VNNQPLAPWNLDGGCVMCDRSYHPVLCTTCLIPASFLFVHAAFVARHEAAQAYRKTSASLKAGRTPCRRRAVPAKSKLARVFTPCPQISAPTCAAREFGLRLSGDRLC